MTVNKTKKMNFRLEKSSCKCLEIPMFTPDKHGVFCINSKDGFVVLTA